MAGDFRSCETGFICEPAVHNFHMYSNSVVSRWSRTPQGTYVQASFSGPSQHNDLPYDLSDLKMTCSWLS